MSCNNCPGADVIAVQGITTVFPNCCEPCSNCQSGSLVDANCVVYTGPALPCTAIATNTSLEDILVAFDQALCSTVGDYSTYNTYCLAPINTQQEFVEAVSNLACQTKTGLDYFINVTFVDYEENVDSQFSAINNPNIVCSSAGVSSSDSLIAVLQKYCAKFASIDSEFDLSSVNWSQCFTTSIPPTTVAGGFSTLLSQICQVKTIASSGGGALPTFNNTGSCLPSPGASDSLVDTVNKIKTRLCQSSTFDINALSWNCIAKPSTTTTDLQDAFQAVLTKLDTISQNFPTFNGDFTVANTGPNPCQGKTIALSSSPYVDKYVAATPSDSSPGTLQDKLQEGTNITFDYTTPGKCIVNSTGGGGTDEKVKAASSDPSAGYLIEKINGLVGASGITVTANFNATTNQVDVGASVDPGALMTYLINAVNEDPTLLALWCGVNTQCPSPCSSPSNVQVTYISGTTSTTTTTTTTEAP